MEGEEKSAFSHCYEVNPYIFQDVITLREFTGCGLKETIEIKGYEVKIMKEGIHPNYYQAKVVCNCGNEFVTGSTKEDIHVEVCSKCHSFYTGQQKAAAARGRIDKFNRK